MRSIKKVYPEFADRVTFYAVGIDPFETLEELESYRNALGLPFPIARPVGNEILSDFRVLQRSTKVAIDADGLIIYRGEYGLGNSQLWREVFRKLAESRGQ